MMLRRYEPLAAFLGAFLTPMLRMPHLPPSPLELLLARKPRPGFTPYDPHPRCPYAAAQRRRKCLRKQRRALHRRSTRS